MVGDRQYTNKPIIDLENIYKYYGAGDLLVMALQDVSLTINPGEYCAIMGPSGSGKSTLMNIIGCLDQPNSGEYYLDRQAVAQLHENELAAIRNLKIGFVFQQFNLLSQLNALENVMLPMAYANVPHAERHERAEAALAQLGLEERIDHYPNQLSGGQQQRVAIARAIVNQPVLLLADEPTGALDSVTRQEIMNIFQALNDSGMTIVTVTHDQEVGNCCQRIVRFRDGQIIDDNLTLASRSMTKT